MTHRLRRFLVVPSVLAVLLGAACSEDRPERAVTIETGDSESPGIDLPGQQQPDDDESDDVEEVEAPKSSAGRELTEDEAKAALLTVDDLPSGWTTEPNDEDDDDEDTVEPKRCADASDALDLEVDDADVEAEATFSKGGAFGVLLFQSIGSNGDEFPDDVVQEIADLYSECPEFTTTDSEGQVSNVTVSPMSFANLGDQTLAITMTLESESFTVSLNVAIIVIGHNVIFMGQGGLTGADGAELEKFAKIAVRKLERVTA